jgi:hypothetical protein
MIEYHKRYKFARESFISSFLRMNLEVVASMAVNPSVCQIEEFTCQLAKPLNWLTL